MTSHIRYTKPYMKKLSLSQDLSWRGFVNQTTYKDITAVDGDPITFYWGVDPSAPSMTIGNFAVAMMVKHFLRHGHKAILLVGGATGMIGDPDGKSEERSLKTIEEISKNKQGIISQYEKIFDGLDFEVVDNFDWFKDINYLDFLRDTGKHVPMRQMLGRDFVQKRLSSDGTGISYAEFSYVLIQAYDFLYLNQNKGATLQMCGSDQWGNCIAGVDLIRRKTGNETHVWSCPLVINKTTGIKFGKTEGGAVWLDPAMTSPYKFYQFWLNSDDDGVEDYLKIYSELDESQINDIMSQFENNRSERIAQKTLAYEITSLVHGKDTAQSLKRLSDVLFGNSDYSQLSREDFEQIKQDLKVVSIGDVGSSNLVDLLIATSLAQSKSEARRYIEAKAIYINGIQIDSEKTTIEESDMLHDNVIIRRGKNAQAIVEK